MEISTIDAEKRIIIRCYESLEKKLESEEILQAESTVLQILECESTRYLEDSIEREILDLRNGISYLKHLHGNHLKGITEVFSTVKDKCTEIYSNRVLKNKIVEDHLREVRYIMDDLISEISPAIESRLRTPFFLPYERSSQYYSLIDDVKRIAQITAGRVLPRVLDVLSSSNDAAIFRSILLQLGDFNQDLYKVADVSERIIRDCEQCIDQIERFVNGFAEQHKKVKTVLQTLKPKHFLAIEKLKTNTLNEIARRKKLAQTVKPLLSKNEIDKALDLVIAAGMDAEKLKVQKISYKILEKEYLAELITKEEFAVQRNRLIQLVLKVVDG